MKTKRHIFETLAMLLALSMAFAMVLRNGGVASGYPAGPTPTPSNPQGLVPRAYLPVVEKNYPLPQPPGYWTESEYVDSGPGLSSIASALGQHDSDTAIQDRVLVLDFGGQDKISGQWGADQIFTPTFLSHAQIVSEVVDFATQYWRNTGTDLSSHLTIGVGTNNAALSDGQFATDRGTEWANMVDEINQGIYAGTYISTQVTVVGANDIEDWSSTSYAATNTWMQAYMNASACVPGDYENKCLIDYGNAHCPDVIGSTSDQCWGTWSMEQTLLMGSAVKRPGDAYRFIITIPEIYNTGGAQARQWANLSLWGVNHGYAPIWFAGTFTEWTRCQDPGASCSGINNKPSTGWCQLQAALITRDEITQIAFRWMTDINRQLYAGQSDPGVAQCP